MVWDDEDDHDGSEDGLSEWVDLDVCPPVWLVPVLEYRFQQRGIEHRRSGVWRDGTPRLQVRHRDSLEAREMTLRVPTR